jgi:uncharacterized sulfatase
MMPSKAGVATNNLPLGRTIYHMGQRFAALGYATAYTGKWHLDGHDYFGDGVCPDGWDKRYWYDGKNHLDALSDDEIALWRQGLKSIEDLKRHDIRPEFTWAHRVSDRAIDFLADQDGQKPFVLVASYDEPHGPATCPPEYAEAFAEFEFPLGPSAQDRLTDKPEHQRQWAGDAINREGAATRRAPLTFGANSFVDAEMGRVIEAAGKHPNTWIFYTSDHGDHLGQHRLVSKGPSMYDAITRIPLIVSGPDAAGPSVVDAPISHVDLLPTMLELAGHEPEPIFDGAGFASLLRGQSDGIDRGALMEFHRHSLSHDGWGGFVPIRCLVRGRYKLVINLLDTDELYDLEEDPHEIRNRIDETALAADREEMMDALLERMNHTRDPFRGPCWEDRPWRRKRTLGFWGAYRMKPDDGFSSTPRVYATGQPEDA